MQRRSAIAGAAAAGVTQRTALAAFAGTVVLAGGNAVAIRFSNRELDPLWGAGLRFALAAALLGAVMAAMRLPPPRGRALAGAAVFGSFNFGAAFGLAYYALVELHAGFGQTLLATVPLLTLLLAVAQRQEALRPRALAGALLALAGVGVMTGAPAAAAAPLGSVVAALASAVCMAEAAVLVRRVPPVHPVTMNAVGMAAGAVLLVAAAVVAGEELAMPGRSATLAAVGYLVIAGSAGVFVLYLVVLRHWAASRAAYIFVLIPFVTVALSTWLDDEPLGPGLVAGGLLVVGGVHFGALRPPRDTNPGVGR